MTDIPALKYRIERMHNDLNILRRSLTEFGRDIDKVKEATRKPAIVAVYRITAVIGWKAGEVYLHLAGGDRMAPTADFFSKHKRAAVGGYLVLRDDGSQSYLSAEQMAVAFAKTEV